MSRCNCIEWGRESCETTPTKFVVWLSPCIGGNEARGVLVGSSIVKTTESFQEETESEALLARGEGPWLSTELLDWVLGPRVAFHLRKGGSRYIGKNSGASTGVCISTFVF
jgi:hypothetical protein